MRKTDLYEVTIKTLGFYMLSLFFIRVVSVIYYLLFFFSEGKEKEYSLEGYASYYYLELVSLGFLTFGAWFFLFKTKWILKKVCVPEEFHESIQFTLDKQKIMELAIKVIALVLIIWSVPVFIMNLQVFLVKGMVLADLFKDFNFNLMISGMKIIIGILLLFFSQHLLHFLMPEHKEGIEE